MNTPQPSLPNRIPRAFVAWATLHLLRHTVTGGRSGFKRAARDVLTRGAKLGLTALASAIVHAYITNWFQRATAPESMRAATSPFDVEDEHSARPEVMDEFGDLMQSNGISVRPSPVKREVD